MTEIKFQNKTFKQKTIIKRLRWYFDNATANEISNTFYQDANDFCTLLATNFDISLFKIAGVVAALSPQKNWQENKKITHMFLSGERKSHTKQQLKKAEMCLLASNETEIFNLLTAGGLKTSFFFLNILYPSIDTGVTVDRHAIGACINDVKNIQVNMENAKMTKLQYDFFANCYIKLAKKEGIIPSQLQAIIWHCYRRLKSLPNEYKIS